MAELANLEFRVVRGKGENTGMFRLEPMRWLTEAEIAKLKLHKHARLQLWSLKNEVLSGHVL